MAAGLGFKDFTTGEVLTAADTNGFLMQGVLVFADTAARDAAITAPAEGQFCFTKDTNTTFFYDGAVWVVSGATGDIEGVTAGTGISGGGTSGTVTITNSMATEIDAKGDLIVGTGADTFSRLAVGTNGQVLTADSNETTGLKFATPAGGGGKVLQVVYASTTTAVSVATSGSPQDTGLQGTITPSAATSKVLIMANQSFYNFGANRGWSGAIDRGGTDVYFQDNGAGQGSSNINAETRGIVQIQFVDSPNTTSATTYKVQARTGSGSGVIYQGDSTPSNIILIEIGA